MTMKVFTRNNEVDQFVSCSVDWKCPMWSFQCADGKCAASEYVCYAEEEDCYDEANCCKLVIMTVVLVVVVIVAE